MGWGCFALVDFKLPDVARFINKVFQDDKGLYDEYYGSDHRANTPVYDEPSDMNYGDSDFHHTGTYTNSDDKFNVAYEKGLDADTLAKSSRFNTNSENYHIYESSQGYQQFEPKSAADATMPPPVQLTKRFQVSHYLELINPRSVDILP